MISKYFVYLITYDDSVYEPYIVTDIIEIDNCINMNSNTYTTLHDFVEDEDGDLISTISNNFTAAMELDLYEANKTCQIILAVEAPLPERVYKLMEYKELRISICK